jgi:hypothetical protein
LFKPEAWVHKPPLGEKDGGKVAAALGVKAVIPDARDPIIAPTPAPIGMVMGRRIKPYSS